MKSWRIVCIAALLVIALTAPMAMADNDKADNSVVGMWRAVYRIGDANGPVFDESFQQFHSDGTEGMISTGSPPALGNVCARCVEAGGVSGVQAPAHGVELELDV